MKKFYCHLIVALSASILLPGCTTPTMGSDVTTFHAWPANLPDKSFVFAPDEKQKASLEYQHYAQLIGEELRFLGFTERKNTPQLQIAFDYSAKKTASTTTVTAVEEPSYGWGWHNKSMLSPSYMTLQKESHPILQYELHITIKQVNNGQNLYEVTVRSTGGHGNTWRGLLNRPADNDNAHQPDLTIVMPYMIRSAFSDFPGPSGVTRHVELELDDFN